MTRRRGRAAFLAGCAMLLTCAATAHAAPATATLITSASPSVPVGGSLSDSAFVFDGSAPTGTITFALFGPADPTCSGVPEFTSPAVPLGSPAVSGSYTPPRAGRYQWVATYSGDANNAMSAGGCGDYGETVMVTLAAPAVSATASGSVPVGGAVTATVAVTGGYHPSGAITFALYAPADLTCNATPLFVSTVGLPTSGPAVSAAYMPTAPGTYRFVATYNGDQSNAAATSRCADASAAVLVTPPPASQSALTVLPHSGPVGSTTPVDCVPRRVAKSLVDAIVAALTGAPGSAFKSTCGGSVRIVLRAREIRPGHSGSPTHDGYTTISNTLTHGSKTGQIAFTINPDGVALRKYARSTRSSLLVFAIVHVRPTSGSFTSESLRIFKLS